MPYQSWTQEKKDVFFQKLLQRINYPGQFTFANQIKVTRVSEDYAEGELLVTPASFNPQGTVHGGCLAALADTVGGTAACSRGQRCVTVNYTMNFLHPAVGKKVYCVASPEKIGRTISVFHVLLTDDQGEMLCSGEYTFFIKGDFSDEDFPD